MTKTINRKNFLRVRVRTTMKLFSVEGTNKHIRGPRNQNLNQDDLLQYQKPVFQFQKSQELPYFLFLNLNLFLTLSVSDVALLDSLALGTPQKSTLAPPILFVYFVSLVSGAP